ncbi:hypothetical protein H0H93_002181 [Arthromyces matolae]|nr:hypothetical protein H0H93_002181 [Arthromyces matolae]
MAGDFVDLSNIPPFDARKWIDTGKLYSDIPFEVQWAKTKAYRVPDAYHYHFPSYNITVKDFIQLKLPKRSAEIITTKPRIWFSHDLPCTDISVLIARPLPPREFLDTLLKDAGQEWLNGAQSIVDPRFNNATDRFPLWALEFWRLLDECVKKQEGWKRGEAWLESEKRKTAYPPTKEAIQEAQDLLARLEWDMPLGYPGSTIRTFSLAQMLGQTWLNDEHIDVMIEELSDQIKKDFGFMLFAPLSFAIQVEMVSGAKNYSRKNAPLLCRYEKHIREQGIEELYFPLHVNNNHWITGCIDFTNGSISYGDPIDVLFTKPQKFHRALEGWLLHTFNRKFKYEGNTLPCAEQEDTHSCGIIVANTLEHAAFGSPLWKQRDAVLQRVKWFIHLSKKRSGSMSEIAKESPPCHSSNDLTIESSIVIALGDHNFPDLRSFAEELEQNSEALDVKGVGTVDVLLDLEVQRPGIRALDEGSIDSTEDDGRDEMNMVAVPQTGMKRRHNFSPSLSEESLSETSSVEGQSGQSRSAKAARKLRKKQKEGTLEINSIKYANFKTKILTIDPNAEFLSKDPFRVRHSGCGKQLAMKEPYDITRFRLHTRDCKSKIRTPSLFAMMGWGKPAKNGEKSIEVSKPKLKEVEEDVKLVPEMYPCPGITPTDDPRVAIYLGRTGYEGGGSRAFNTIACEIFGKPFKLLKPEEKEEVTNRQLHELKWRNDHAHGRVFATACKHTVPNPRFDPKTNTVLPAKHCSECSKVFASRAFKTAINKKPGADKNAIHTNHQYRNRGAGEVFARTQGVKELIETKDARKTPCVRLAQRILSGEFNNEVFEGLIQVMVTKDDRQCRGVGMQNFRHSLAWDEVCNIIRIHSPRALTSLAQYLPIRSHRSFRMHESRAPAFPLTICDRTFELVVEHLEALNYSGPVGLSCDDTKLFSSLRLFWDAPKETYFLIGGTEGPYPVANPDEVKDILADKSITKSTKIRLWCLTIPVPRTTPIIVAALPIANNHTASDLLVYLESILHGLIDRHVQVVLYACDGTEVERSVQKMLIDKSDQLTYTIPNPRPGCSDTRIIFIRYYGQVLCMVQDLKHALKTFRNNLFSGARLLTFGSFTAIFDHIRHLADEEGSPLYKRDVDKLDRQDDNAAARLFSADTLAFIAERHPNYIGEIVYLFVFGELVDAYQNRSISHLERVKLVLCAHYFLDSWGTFLEVTGYPRKSYHLSREAVDIARIIIEGFLALIIIHRDHVQGIHPLLPWLHSSEACEHTFGEARKIVKDFTLLDFLYMVPKLRIKLREATMRARASDPKARAAGYNHTYVDHTGVDIRQLSTFPTDDAVRAAAEDASQEVDSLLALLGLSPAQLHSSTTYNHHYPTLPSIGSWFTPGPDNSSDDHDDNSVTSDGVESDSESISEAQELQDLVNREEDKRLARTKKQEDRLLNLTCASLSVLTDETIAAQHFSEIDEDELNEFLAEEFTTVSHIKNLLDLPSIEAPDEPMKPLGQGHITVEQLDFKALVDMRRSHQTEQARKGVRTRQLVSGTSNDDDPTQTRSKIRRDLIQQFHAALREAQDMQGVGTGTERSVQWRAQDSGSGDGDGHSHVAGNAANAAAAASAAATKSLGRRRKIFTEARVPCISDVTHARVSKLRPLSVEDYGIVYVDRKLMVGRTGKNGKHAVISSASNISSVSYLAVSLYEQIFGRQLRQTSTILQTQRFALLPSTSFLCWVTAPLKTSPAVVELSVEDSSRLSMLQKGIETLEIAMRAVRKRD